MRLSRLFFLYDGEKKIKRSTKKIEFIIITVVIKFKKLAWDVYPHIA